MHHYQYFEELTVYSTDTCAIDYEKGNTLVKNHITKCIIKINYAACAHGPESFAKGREIYFDIKIELLSCYVFLYCSVFTFVSSKKFTGSRKLFPVMISSIEDLSDGGELEKYYPFNRDSEEVHTPSVCSVYHFIWSSYVTGG